MTFAINDTHDASLRSWLDSANDAGSDFPIQNLPLGRFRLLGDNTQPWRLGVAIGDRIVDLVKAGLVTSHDVDAVLGADLSVRQKLRQDLSAGLREGSATRACFEAALVSQSDVELGLPCDVRDYTDFYTSVFHATTIGKQFRPDNPLLPNYKWVPIGYHGRASSILPSGASFRRPRGQTKGPDAAAPALTACARLDYELELGMIVGQANALGDPVDMVNAEDHVFGIALFNDWSARDIQGWEYQPLGPFLSKNFASTLSPWIVTMEALAPFRAPLQRPAGDPDPLPYLDSAENRRTGLLDIELEVWLQTAAMREAGQPGVRLTRGNAREAAYWTAAQLVAHHASGGCNLQPGDLLGSGTLSGPGSDQAGSLLELTQGGKQPITLPDGEVRSFLADGDTLTMRGWCERAGARRIGFGTCSATVLPAPAARP